MYGYIYIITNKINNKKYIGQHASSTFDTNYHGSGKLLKLAIDKYGWDNFTCEILSPIGNVPTICESLDELNQSEYFYINYFDCVNSNEYYNLMNGGNQGGFSDSVRQSMSDKAKNRPHPPTTLNRKWMNNGEINKSVKECDIQQFINDGWVFGKLTHQVAWNKGLTADTDSRVNSYTSARKEKFKNGESIGYCGKSGADSPNFKSDEDIILNIINKNFYDIWYNHGKSYVCNYFHIASSGRIYKRCLELCEITPDQEKQHSHYIRSNSIKNR